MYVLMTTPGYPGLRHAREILRRRGAQPAADCEENDFLPDLDSIPAEVLAQGQGAGASIIRTTRPARAPRRNFSPRWWSSRRRNRIVVIHDAAYAALVFEGKPLSFLATPGAKDVGIELHSTSKSFNMTGWRCGFVAGNPNCSSRPTAT